MRVRGAVEALLGVALAVAPLAAQAAELPSRRAAEKQAVRNCAAHGPGFVWAPALNTCVKLSGGVSVEVQTTGRAGARTQ